ncbi:MAG TPA: alpha/beta hydrolase [Chromatiales bacterium]|nr:alpha/beta hydrolase [Thiotrichales bacterium]HIP69543.1 alpha/beta hydrolase [Chromatiales bacterium]
MPGKLTVIIVPFVLFWLTSRVWSATDDPFPPPGKLIEVSQKQLHINCTGTGSPLVILEAGLGGNSLDWVKVQPMLASFTRVCSYDRAGYGWSDGDALPRTSARSVYELYGLLHKAGEEGPYLLAGHSFGGFIVRMFASLHPDETSGVVLLDASHEDQFTSLSHNNRQKGRGMRLGAGQPRKLMVPEGLPEEAKLIASTLAENSRAMISLQSEMRHFNDSIHQVRYTPMPPYIPVKVISRGKRVWPEGEKGDRMETAWRLLQEDLYQRLTPASSGLSHQIATLSGHYIHLDEPRLVVRAIRKMVLNQRRLALLENRHDK